MGKWLNGAQVLRAAMDSAGAQLDDAAALDAMAIYPAWEIGAAYAVNDRRTYTRRTIIRQDGRSKHEPRYF